MKKFGPWLWIGGVVLVILIIVGMFWGTYNSLVTKSQAIDAQWAQVETQYQRRFDLIPNLVNTVKGIFEQEQIVFVGIAEARSKIGEATAQLDEATSKYEGAATANEKDAAGVEAGGALGRLIAIWESYPELRSVETVTQLMDNLEGTENRISVERKRYNDLVRDYNTTIKRVPTNIIASMFNFEAREYFQSVSGAETVPKVEF